MLGQKTRDIVLFFDALGFLGFLDFLEARRWAHATKILSAQGNLNVSTPLNQDGTVP